MPLAGIPIVCVDDSFFGLPVLQYEMKKKCCKKFKKGKRCKKCPNR